MKFFLRFYFQQKFIELVLIFKCVVENKQIPIRSISQFREGRYVTRFITQG